MDTIVVEVGSDTATQRSVYSIICRRITETTESPTQNHCATTHRPILLSLYSAGTLYGAVSCPWPGLEAMASENCDNGCAPSEMILLAILYFNNSLIIVRYYSPTQPSAISFFLSISIGLFFANTNFNKIGQCMAELLTIQHIFSWPVL